MPTPLNQDSSGLWGQQGKNAYLDYEIDWSDWLGASETITASTWSADAALTLNSQSIATPATKTRTWAQGGAANTWYAITNSVTSSLGRINQRVIRLFIADVAASPAPDGSALFASRPEAVAALRRNQLVLAAQTLLPRLTVDDDYLWSKLLAAEFDASHQLRCYFAPTVLIPDDAPASEVAALQAAGTRFAQEAAYDYDPDFFRGERWGYIVTKQKPLISVQSMSFNYPNPSNQIFQIPNDWIRMDRKYGHIRLIPAAMAFSAPLSAFIMQAFGGGRTIPFMIQVRYTAGLTNPAADYPELVDLVKKMAVLRIIQDAWLPQSGSISADGLSQSLSIDMDKLQGVIDHGLDQLRDQIHGIRFGVL